MSSEYTTRVRDYRVTVDKVGGGTVGEAYTGDWTVCVMDGDVYLLDNEILTTGTAKTHAQAAHEAVDFAESFSETSY